MLQVAKFFVIEWAIELWSIFHDELDLDGNGHLDAQELTLALSKAGKLTVQELYAFLTIRPKVSSCLRGHSRSS